MSGDSSQFPTFSKMLKNAGGGLGTREAYLTWKFQAPCSSFMVQMVLAT
jgi:hypothetical protein